MPGKIFVNYRRDDARDMSARVRGRALCTTPLGRLAGLDGFRVAYGAVERTRTSTPCGANPSS